MEITNEEINEFWDNLDWWNKDMNALNVSTSGASSSSIVDMQQEVMNISKSMVKTGEEKTKMNSINEEQKMKNSLSKSPPLSFPLSFGSIPVSSCEKNENIMIIDLYSYNYQNCNMIIQKLHTKESHFIIDSGASISMTPHKYLLSEFNSKLTILEVYTANKTPLPVCGEGTMIMVFSGYHRVLTHTLYVPSLSDTLISTAHVIGNTNDMITLNKENVQLLFIT